MSHASLIVRTRPAAWNGGFAERIRREFMETSSQPKSQSLWPRQIGKIRTFPFESDFFNVTCHEIVVEGRPIRYVDSTPLSYGRLTSLFDKEPTTIPWLETFKPDETLVDIGANMGMYTVSYTHLRAHETPEHLVCR